ncbi:hypothetical protein ACTFIU_007299 [Dictyostelium citrinum]
MNTNINTYNNNQNINSGENDVILNIPLLLNKSQRNINVNYGTISQSQPQLQTQPSKPNHQSTSQIYQIQTHQQQQNKLQQQQQQQLNNVLILHKNKKTLLFDNNVYYGELTPYIGPKEYIEVIDLINNISNEALFEKSSSSSFKNKIKFKVFDWIFLACFISILVFFIIAKLYRAAVVVSVLLFLIALISKVLYFFFTKNTDIKISIEQGYENFFGVLSQKYSPLIFKGVFEKKEKSNGEFEYNQTSLIIEYPTYLRTAYVFHNPNEHQCYKQIQPMTNYQFNNQMYNNYSYNENNINTIDSGIVSLDKTSDSIPPQPTHLNNNQHSEHHHQHQQQQQHHHHHNNFVSLNKSTTSLPPPTNNSSIIEIESLRHNPQLEIVENNNDDKNILIKLKKPKGDKFNTIFPNVLEGWTDYEKHCGFITELNNVTCYTKSDFIKQIIFLSILSLGFIAVASVIIGLGRAIYSTYILYGIGGLALLLLLAIIAAKISNDKNSIKERYKTLENNYSENGKIKYEIKNKKTRFSQINLFGNYHSKCEEIIVTIQVPSLSPPVNFNNNQNPNSEKFQIM